MIHKEQKFQKILEYYFCNFSVLSLIYEMESISTLGMKHGRETKIHLWSIIQIWSLIQNGSIIST